MFLSINIYDLRRREDKGKIIEKGYAVEELLKLAQQMEVQQLLMFIALYWLMSRKIDSKIDVLEKKMETSFAKVEDKLDKLSDRVTSLEGRVSHIEDRIGKIEDKIDKLSDRISGLESRVSRIEGMMMNKECCLLSADEKKKAL